MARLQDHENMSAFGSRQCERHANWPLLLWLRALPTARQSAA